MGAKGPREPFPLPLGKVFGGQDPPGGLVFPLPKKDRGFRRRGGEQHVQGPTLIIVGSVVSLHTKLHWYLTEKEITAN